MNGFGLKDHDIKKEMERTKGYFKKITDAEAKIRGDPEVKCNITPC